MLRGGGKILPAESFLHPPGSPNRAQPIPELNLVHFYPLSLSPNFIYVAAPPGRTERIPDVRAREESSSCSVHRPTDGPSSGLEESDAGVSGRGR